MLSFSNKMSRSSRDPAPGDQPCVEGNGFDPLVLAHYRNSYFEGCKGGKSVGKGGHGVSMLGRDAFMSRVSLGGGVSSDSVVEVSIPVGSGEEALPDYRGKGYGPSEGKKGGYGISNLIYGRMPLKKGSPDGTMAINVREPLIDSFSSTRGKGSNLDTHYFDYIPDQEEEVSQRKKEARRLKRAKDAESLERREFEKAPPGTRIDYRRPTLLQQREFAGRVRGGTLLESPGLDAFANDDERHSAYQRLCHWCVFNQEDSDFKSDMEVPVKSEANEGDKESAEKWMITEADLNWYDALTEYYGESFECDSENQEGSFNSLMYDMQQVARKSMFSQLKCERDLRRSNFKNRYRDKCRAWETALINVFNTESANLGFCGFTTNQMKEMARDLRRTYGYGDFSSDQQLHSWWSNFRKRHRLFSTKAKYSSRLSAEVLWRRIHKNWFQFDQAMAEVQKRREAERERHGTMGPLILLNADETFVLHQYPAGSVVRKRGAHLPHSVLTEEGVKGGCSLLCWQTSNPVFHVPPVVITNFQNPSLPLKRRLRSNLDRYFPGALYYPSGNSHRGVSWNDHTIWGRCLQMVIDYKKSFGGRCYVILVYDSAPSHSMRNLEGLFNKLSESDILLVRLQGKTTAFSQPLDSEGYLRTLKSRLRLESLTERQHLAERYCTVSGNVFPCVLRETQRDMRYSTLRCWHRLGFSHKFFAARVQGDWVTGASHLSRRLTLLGNEARKQSSMGEGLDEALAGTKRKRLQYQRPDRLKHTPKAKEKPKAGTDKRVVSEDENLSSDSRGSSIESAVAIGNSVAKAAASEPAPKRRNLRPWRSTRFGIVYRRQ